MYVRVNLYKNYNYTDISSATILLYIYYVNFGEFIRKIVIDLLSMLKPSISLSSDCDIRVGYIRSDKLRELEIFISWLFSWLIITIIALKIYFDIFGKRKWWGSLIGDAWTAPLFDLFWPVQKMYKMSYWWYACHCRVKYICVVACCLLSYLSSSWLDNGGVCLPIINRLLGL